MRALNIARYSELAAFNPTMITLSQFSQLRPPFFKRADRSYARAICTAIAYEARFDTRKLHLDELFVACSIAVHRYKLKQRRPPAYNVVLNEVDC